jgi:hypothetical protein
MYETIELDCRVTAGFILSLCNIGLVSYLMAFFTLKLSHLDYFSSP